MPKQKGHWWENAPLTVGDFTDAQLNKELARAQQVGEDVAAAWAAWAADNQPCPSCGYRVGDHTRRQLRRCDNSRPDLQLVG
jgi:hypothetical protein